MKACATILIAGLLSCFGICVPPDDLPDPPTTPPLLPPEQQVVVLDWTGGTRTGIADLGVRLMNLPSLPNEMPAADLSVFSVWPARPPFVGDPQPIDGITLADFPTFLDDVRDRTQETLDKLRPQNILVVNGEPEDHPGATVIWLSHLIETDFILGRATRDDCNMHSADEGVLYLHSFTGQFIMGALRPFYDSWVQIFANVTAHEIGHTLGFRHSPTIAEVTGFDLMRPASNTSQNDRRQFLVEYAGVAGEQPDMQCNNPDAMFAGDRDPTEYTFVGQEAIRTIIPEMNNIGWPANGSPFDFLTDPFDPDDLILATEIEGFDPIFCDVGLGFDGSAAEALE